MSDSTPAKPVSPFSVLAILGCFALFLLLVYLVYLPKDSGAFNGDGIHTVAQREERLAKMRANEAKHANNYAWIDQSAGVVQLPIERAMELTVQRYGHRN